MEYLKSTEVSFLDIIDLRDGKFNDIIKQYTTIKILTNFEVNPKIGTLNKKTL